MQTFMPPRIRTHKPRDADPADCVAQPETEQDALVAFSSTSFVALVL